MTEPALISTLSALSTACVSDALDRLGIVGQAFGIRRRSGSGCFAGPAFTVRYEPLGTDDGDVGDYIDDVEPGSVIVLANAGRPDVTVWGGLLSTVASRRGLAATVVDGACRDLAAAEEVGYPLYSSAHWMRTGKDRVRAEALQVPVSIGGVRTRPGDLVIGDADGVVVVPAGDARRVLDVAQGIEAAEQEIRAEVDGGSRLDVARRAVGYFTLQRRDQRPEGV